MRQRRTGALRRWIWTFVGLGVFAVVAVSVALSYAYSRISLPTAPPPLQTTTVYDVEGRSLGSFHATIDRTVVPLRQMSESLREAVIATEDASFYEHVGVDPLGILRAAVVDIIARDSVQGGSTITQQLVKTVYAGTYEQDPDSGELVYVQPERTIPQKVREALLAIKLEQDLDKDQILARYLNTIYFGNGAYGVQAAAQTYWRKDASRLNVIQSATLAAMIRSPNTYDPISDPDRVFDRRNYVLSRMVEEGYLTEDEAASYRERPVKVSPLAGTSDYPARLGYFLDHVRRQLVDRYGGSTVYGGGLSITTTLDLDVQRAAEEAVAGWLSSPDGPDAAVVAIDPRTGAIRAMVGGRDFAASQVNLATGQGGTGRQAGSAFKTFTLVAAMEQMFSLDSVWDGPETITIPDERCFTDGEPWTLSNASDEEDGVFSLEEATWHSVNTIYAQLVVEVGPEAVVDAARRLGIVSPLDPYCAITLGTQAVNPLEMTVAYATLAARGERHAPYSIATITGPSRRELFAAEIEGSTVMDANDADLVTAAMSGVLTSGTGTAAAFGRPAAGKTGTAQDYADAWFCGYTPQLATCVWMGYPDAERPMTDIGGFAAVYGGTIPARIWHDVMAAAHEGLPVETFAVPSTDGYTRSPASPAPSPDPSATPSLPPSGSPVPTPSTMPSLPPLPSTSPRRRAVTR